MKKIGFLLVLLVGLVVSGCGDRVKQSAVFAITQAKADISMARNDSNVKKTKISLIKAESLINEADAIFNSKDYSKAKSLAEEASNCIFRSK
ncbi:MAG TPA: hypothetical protein DCP53_07770, partial [Elusimicrobia bacterium]|nr:hypothetical protein [Elusimicrobiota bacterium]